MVLKIIEEYRAGRDPDEQREEQGGCGAGGPAPVDPGSIFPRGQTLDLLRHEIVFFHDFR